MVAVSPLSKNVIRFSEYEKESIRKIIREYKKNPSNQLKMQIIDKFTPSIQLKAAKAAVNSGISSIDYAQDLYLRLLETLDSAMRSRKHVLATILNTLNKTESTQNRAVRTNSKTIEELTQEEIFSNASCCQDETHLDDLSALSPKMLAKEVEIMNMVSEGISLKEALRRFYGYYDFVPKFHTSSQKSENAQNVNDKQQFDAEKIWDDVKKSFGPIDVVKELDVMMRTQTTCKELFTDKSSKTKLNKKLALEPDFYFELKLSRKTDNQEFKRAAYSLSKKMFGRNIFKFTN